MSDESKQTGTRPDERTMRGVIPYLDMRGRAGEAADFYARAFAARDLGRIPSKDTPGWFMHVQVEINGGALMMCDHQSAEDGADSSVVHGHLQLVVAEGAMWWKRAVEAGCRVVSPFERQFWGDLWGLLEDPFGVRWAVLEPGPESS